MGSVTVVVSPVLFRLIAEGRVNRMAEYIEREAALKLLEDEARCGYLDAVDINSIPAADVAPVVHGRWFDTGVENATGNIYFCSVCRKYNNPNKKDVEMKRTKEKPAYCPNCGAKMELEGGEG